MYCGNNIIISTDDDWGLLNESFAVLINIHDGFYKPKQYFFRIDKMFSRGQNQELHTLEDIFRQKERDLENGILNFTSRDKGSFLFISLKNAERQEDVPVEIKSLFHNVTVYSKQL